jgi:hypothetical protein
MVPLSALWLPIVLSAIIIFVASFVMHMLLTYHRSNYQQLPDEDKISSTLRAANLQRGTYVFPFCTPKEMKSPAAQEKYKQGPVGLLTIMPPGPPAMPKFLGLWSAYTLLVSFFVAYLTAHTVAPGSSYPAVFRVAGTAAFLAYGLGALPSGIWKGQTASVTAKEVVDGLIYALLTAGTFGWLWPRAAGM